MADTSLAIETLVKRFDGHVCRKFTLFFKKIKTNIYFLLIIDNSLGSAGKKRGKKQLLLMDILHIHHMMHLT